MSIELHIRHVGQLRLRQQSARNVDRTNDGIVKKGAEWSFEKDDVQQDTDQRRRDEKGKPLQLGTYTAHIAAGLKNLVIENKGPHISVDFRNSSLRNQLRIKYQAQVDQKKGDKVVGKEWKDSGPAQYIAPNTPAGVYVGDGQRAILDEQPT